MAAHFCIDVDAVGEGTVTVNGTDVTHTIAGWDVSSRGRGQPTIVSLHATGPVDLDGDGIVHILTEATAADVQAEVAELLAGLAANADDLWQAAMQRPEAAQPGGPARAFLLTIIDLLTGDVP